MWTLLAMNCLFLAMAIPLILLALSFISPLVPSGADLVVLGLKVVALFLAMAALCAWFGFRGHRAAFAIADVGAKAACAGADVVRRRFRRMPRPGIGRRRRPVPAVPGVSPLLGRPWDGLVLVTGWVTFALVAWIPMRPATETGGAVFLAGAAACVAMTLLYAGVGRVYLRGRERQAVRRFFQPFLLGTALMLGMAALGIGIALAYGPF